MSWLVTLIMVLIVSFAIGTLRAPDLPERAPEFSAHTLAGEPVTLAALKGQPVVLNFWATWCGPCRFEVPAISRFTKRHPDIAVWGVAVEPAPRIRQAIDELEIDYPIILGDSELLATYGVTTFPTTIFIDREGHIHSAHVGALWDPQLELAAWGL
jgi:cytochrome c biogenesis protein CcmG/thiol:disulfide interchange protein DsbE